MTDQVHLERAYRRLLACYPPAFRREQGQELLAVLMACAPDGQRWPSLASCADLIGSGLRMRLRPAVPRSPRAMRVAVRLMYAGAAFTTLSLIVSIVALPFVHAQRAAGLRLFGRSQPLPVAITVGIVGGLVLIALWLWMARANGRGRNWARIVSTMLVGLATLQLFSEKDVAQLVFALVTWLVGLAAVSLLWRPASNAFFKPERLTKAAQAQTQRPARTD
jgi:hypothetical protein